MKSIRIKKFEKEDNNIYYSTDNGFDPNNLLRVTVRINLNKITTNERGVYEVKIYSKDSNSIQNLEIANIEVFFILENIQELFKNDLSQFDRILLESAEYYD